MIPLLCRNWWAVALRGLMALIFALAILLWPRLSLLMVVLVFGVYAAIDGVFALISALRAAKEKARWWPFLLEGLIGLTVGVVTFVQPAITARALLWLVAAWALLTGVLRIVAAIRLRREIRGEWLLVLSGLASVGFGVGISLFPEAGALAIVCLLAAFVAVLGVLPLILGFRLRALRRAV